jgi:hypothetical protein
VLIVGFFKELGKGSEYEAFTKFAQKTEDAVFVQTTDAAVAKAAGISGSAPAVALIANHPGEERATAVAKKVNADSIEAVLKENKLPLTVPFSDETSPKIFGSGIEKQVLLIAKAADLDLKSDKAKAIKALRAVAANYRGKLTFVTVDVEGKSAAPVTGFFGVKAEVSQRGIVLCFFSFAAHRAPRRLVCFLCPRRALKKKSFSCPPKK